MADSAARVYVPDYSWIHNRAEWIRTATPASSIEADTGEDRLDRRVHNLNGMTPTSAAARLARIHASTDMIEHFRVAARTQDSESRGAGTFPPATSKPAPAVDRPVDQPISPPTGTDNNRPSAEDDLEYAHQHPDPTTPSTQAPPPSSTPSTRPSPPATAPQPTAPPAPTDSAPPEQRQSDGLPLVMDPALVAQNPLFQQIYNPDGTRRTPPPPAPPVDSPAPSGIPAPTTPVEHTFLGQLVLGTEPNTPAPPASATTALALIIPEAVNLPGPSNTTTAQVSPPSPEIMDASRVEEILPEGVEIPQRGAAASEWVDGNGTRGSLSIDEYGQRHWRFLQSDGRLIEVTQGGGSDGADRPWTRTKITEPDAPAPRVDTYATNGVTAYVDTVDDLETRVVLHQGGDEAIEEHHGGSDGADRPWTQTTQLTDHGPFITIAGPQSTTWQTQFGDRIHTRTVEFAGGESESMSSVDGTGPGWANSISAEGLRTDITTFDGHPVAGTFTDEDGTELGHLRTTNGITEFVATPAYLDREFPGQGLDSLRVVFGPLGANTFYRQINLTGEQNRPAMPADIPGWTRSGPAPQRGHGLPDSLAHSWTVLSDQVANYWAGPFISAMHPRAGSDGIAIPRYQPPPERQHSLGETAWAAADIIGLATLFVPLPLPSAARLAPYLTRAAATGRVAATGAGRGLAAAATTIAIGQHTATGIRTGIDTMRSAGAAIKQAAQSGASASGTYLSRTTMTLRTTVTRAWDNARGLPAGKYLEKPYVREALERANRDGGPVELPIGTVPTGDAIRHLLTNNKSLLQALQSNKLMERYLLEESDTLLSLLQRPKAIDIVDDALRGLRYRMKYVPANGDEIVELTKVTDAQRAISERAQRSVRAVTGGTGKKPTQPGFDYGRQQDPGYVSAFLDDLYAKFPAAQGQLKRLADDLSRSLGGVAYGRKVAKGRARAMQKIDGWEGDASRLIDMAGASITFKTVDKIYRALDDIQKSGMKILYLEDRIIGPQLSGYRDITMNVRADNGMVVELRLHLESIDKASKEFDHAVYEVTRGLNHYVNSGKVDPVEAEKILDEIALRTNDIFLGELAKGVSRQ
ncbi:hypothetical protein [Nocardia arizonensis]|uniref:hypothetical protein n=1 Tax=Nocardia arizonensis TaxID=1141647 RepID=UPI0006D06EC4|nr:hypothetical protein [Nocardia arizonensis]